MMCEVYAPVLAYINSKQSIHMYLYIQSVYIHMLLMKQEA